jgi:hypothetical protein
MVKFASIHDPNLAIVINILSQIFETPLHGDVQSASTQADPLANFNLLHRSTSGFPSEENDATLPKNMEPLSNQTRNFKLSSESANLHALEPFFGRESELVALAKHLGQGLTSSRQVASVYGPPGIGKSHFMAHYINLYRANYDNIFCLDGTTIEQLRLTLRREANRIRQSWSDLLFKALSWPDTNIERFCTFLNTEGNEKWLLVIDEMRESSSNIASIFERLKQGSIVLISSSSQYATRYPAVRLGPLESSPSVEMLLHHSPDPDLKITLGMFGTHISHSTTNNLEHHDLLSTLDHHPALIRLAVPKMLGFKTISYFLLNWQNGQIKLPSQMMSRIKGILADEFPNGLPPSQKSLLDLCLLIIRQYHTNFSNFWVERIWNSSLEITLIVSGDMDSWRPGSPTVRPLLALSLLFYINTFDNL